MDKEIRFNADMEVSKTLRSIKAQYDKEKAPTTISLERLANAAIKNGIQATRQQLGLTNGK